MEASGSTPPSARVFRKFDKSRPTTLCSTSHPLLPLLFSPTFQPRRTHRPLERAMKFPRRPNLSLFPGRFWAGTRYTSSFPPRKLLSPPTDLAWIHILLSLSLSLCPVCSSSYSSPTTYFAVTLLLFLRVDHRTRSRCHKKADQKK